MLTSACRDVKLFADIPGTALVEHSVDVYRTYLDTVGRTAVHIKARNLVDEFRDRDLIISYEVPFLVTLRKPFIIFSSMATVFVAAWLLGKLDVGISKK